MAVGTRTTTLFGAAMLVALATGNAHGDSSIASGGPAKKADKEKLAKSLARIAPSLEVCWRGQRPDAVRVSLRVAADGAVLEAKQKTDGPAAQCAAGVLAVQTLAATGKKYDVVVELVTAALDLGAQIQNDLRGYHAALQSCGNGVEGIVVLKFKIHPDGSVSGAAIESSTLEDESVHKCLRTAINKAKLTERPDEKVLGYALTVNLPGAESGASSKSAASTKGAATQPQKTGPRPAGDITKVMDAKISEYAASYKKRAKKKPTLSGTVVLRFTIRPAGTVRNVKVRETSLADSVVEDCLVKVAATLDFGAHASTEVTKVFYPFNFGP